jgi:hypothetical protein
LPFPGNTTPAIYEVNGRQFVVIATEGSSLMIAKGWAAKRERRGRREPSRQVTVFQAFPGR